MQWSASWTSPSAMIGSESCTQQDSCEGQLWTGGGPTQFRERFRSHNVPAGVMNTMEKEFLALKQVNLDMVFQHFPFELVSPLFYLSEA